MELIPEERRETLIQNGRTSARLAGTAAEPDFAPAVKLFAPDANCAWLLSELDPDDPDIAFGLCDLGVVCPELGSVRISGLEAARGPLGVKIERDLHFVATKSIVQYADNACLFHMISA
jgi:hypothetical protein